MPLKVPLSHLWKSSPREARESNAQTIKSISLTMEMMSKLLSNPITHRSSKISKSLLVSSQHLGVDDV